MEEKQKPIEVEKTYSYKEGMQAYFGSIPLRFNPYPIVSRDYFYWESGWLAAQSTECEFFNRRIL